MYQTMTKKAAITVQVGNAHGPMVGGQVVSFPNPFSFSPALFLPYSQD